MNKSTIKIMANLVIQIGMPLAKHRGCGVSEMFIPASYVRQLAEMLEEGQVNWNGAKVIYSEMAKNGDRNRLLWAKLMSTALIEPPISKN